MHISSCTRWFSLPPCPSLHCWIAACLALSPGVGLAQGSGSVEFSVAGFSGQERSGAVQVVLYRSFAFGPAFAVELSTRDGSAQTGEDYLGTNMLVNFPSGTSNKTVAIRLLDDTRFEGVETFTVALANPTAGVVLGPRQEATVSIVDDESNAPGSVDGELNAGGGFDGPVLSLAFLSNEKVIVGGQFSQVDGRTRFGLAQFNQQGTLDNFEASAMQAGDTVLALAEEPGHTLVVARTRVVSGILRGELVRLRPDGSQDDTFAGGLLPADAPIRALALQADGRILVGGAFTTLGDVPRSFIARVNRDGTLDEGFQPAPDGPVNCLALSSGGRIFFGGEFTRVNGATRIYVASLLDQGSLDESFVPGQGNTVRNGTGVKSLAIQADGRPILSGDFSILYGRGQSALMRLLPDGQLDQSYVPNVPTADTIYSVVLQPDGKAIVGGNFLRLAAPTCCATYDRKGIARLNRDGSVDTSFNPGTGIRPADVRALALQPDLMVLAGGSFTNVNGLARTNLTRFYGDIRTRIHHWEFSPAAGMILAITNEPERLFIIEATTNLADWQPIATNQPAANFFNFVDGAATNLARRVYRVREEVR